MCNCMITAVVLLNKHRHMDWCWIRHNVVMVSCTITTGKLHGYRHMGGAQPWPACCSWPRCAPMSHVVLYGSRHMQMRQHVVRGLIAPSQYICCCMDTGTWSGTGSWTVHCHWHMCRLGCHQHGSNSFCRPVDNGHGHAGSSCTG